MNRKRVIPLIITALLPCLPLKAQNVADLIISEVMPVTDSTSLEDGFGLKSGWIEVFNTSQGTVNFGGCYFTDDRANLQKSLISNLDRSTKLGPRQCVLFYASGRGGEGTYYTTFPVRPGSTLYLISNDGRTIVDSMVIPANIPAGKSIVKLAHDVKALDFEASPEPADPTPGSYNAGGNQTTGAQELAQTDPHGLTLTLVSVLVVFSALLLLWFIFTMLFQHKKRPAAEAKQLKAPARTTGSLSPETAAAISMALDAEFGGEVHAAMGLAMHEYLEGCVHDNESFVLTIRRSQSAWNDKSRNFRQLPR